MNKPYFRVAQIKKGSFGEPCFQMVDYYFESNESAELWIKERLDLYHIEGYRNPGRNWFVIIQDFSPSL